MPRIDKIVEPMSLGNYDEAALLSDSSVRLKARDGREELGITLTHRQITSLVEEIIPSKLFGNLVMMETVEFTYRHQAGVLNIKVSPGRSLWRVEVEAPQGLNPFRESRKNRRKEPKNDKSSHKGDEMNEKKPPEDKQSETMEPIEEKESGEIDLVPFSRFSEGRVEPVSEDDSQADDEDGADLSPEDSITHNIIPPKPSKIESSEREDERPLPADSEKIEEEQKLPESESPQTEPGNNLSFDEKELSSGDLELLEDLELQDDITDSFPERIIRPGDSEDFPEKEEEDTTGPTLEPTDKCSELLERAMIAESGTLILIPGQRPWIYGPQGYTPMPGARTPVNMDLIDELLENNESISNRLQKRKALRVIYGHRKESSFVRCILTRNNNKVTAAFRIPLADPAHPSHIGLPGGTTKLIRKGGVLLAASQTGEGRTTTAFVMGSALMSSGHSTALVVGRPLERRLIASSPVFSFDMEHKEMARGMMLAIDIGASVVIADDAPIPSIENTVRLAERGISVVFTIQADSAMSALTHCLNGLKGWKKRIPELSRLIKGVIYQELIRTNKDGRTPVFERILPSTSLLQAVAEGQWELLGGYSGKAVASPPLSQSLEALVEKGVIDAHTAGKHLSKR